MNMLTPLIDPEGFPRSDIDVAGIRTARSQINRLRNDLKDVMNEMSKLLERGLPRMEEVHSNGNGASTLNGDVGNGMDVDEKDGTEEELVAFAKVDGVFPNSPADIAVSSNLLYCLILC